MDGERGLRRDRGIRRSSRERLLPPEAFQHNRDDRKKDAPKVKKVSNSPPQQKRARSRERSPERKRLRDTSCEKTPQILEQEIQPSVNEHNVEEPLNEPGKESSDKGNDKFYNEDLIGVSVGDNAEAPINAEEGEEVFSDFGESDEEILTKEGVLDLDNEVLGGSGDTRTSNRPESQMSSQKSAPSQNKYKTGVLDISGDLDEVSQGDDDDEGEKTKDALDVDWSELISKPEGFADKVEETGVLKKRWSLAAILNRVGLSESLVGKKKYNEIIALANKDVEDSLQFKPMHRMQYLDMYLRNRVERRRTIVSEHGPYTRALTARRDLSIRRFLCHMSEEESSAFCSTPNTNWDWFRHVAETFGEKE